MHSKFIDDLVNNDCVEYLRLPNVNIILQSEKITNGIKTGKQCLTFGVTEKKINISEDEKIPEKIKDIPTDVIKVGPFYARSATHQLKYRPVIGGVSGIVGLNAAGTLGGVVHHNTTGKLVGLTNNHCAGSLYDPAYAIPDNGSTNTTGLDFLQPSHGDGGNISSDVLGQVLTANPQYFGLASGTPTNLIDAALIDLSGVNIPWFSIHNIHAGPFPFASKESWNIGDTVSKSGRTTGVTSGTVISKSASLTVSFEEEGDNNKVIFTDQIVIESSECVLSGDSGSLATTIISGVINIVGLVFASDNESIGVINHITNVADVLNVSSWDGRIVVPQTSSGEITVNSTQFLRHSDVSLSITHNQD